MWLSGSPQERAWAVGEADTVALMGTINLAVARLVATIRMLIDTEGWAGGGIRSIEHWVCWKAGMSPKRAGDLVRIARRVTDLPECWALFEQGRLTEDAMIVIARKVPACRDAEVAGWAPGFLISQLRRALASCPEQVDPEAPPKPEPERYLRFHRDERGWGKGEFQLPPDEMARLQIGLDAARDAEFRDRQNLEADAEVISNGSVPYADAFARLVHEGTDTLDATVVRTGHPGERNKLVVHCEVQPDGTLGPGQIHQGPVIANSLRRFLSCDAEVMVATYHAGHLLGIHPTDRTVNRATRRVIEHRDQGCTHPLCNQRRFLHIHHLQPWEHGGETVPWNLLSLCQRHHRELHQGDFSIEGNPETGTLRFHDQQSRPIEPPDQGPAAPPPPPGPTPYTPPYGERLDSRWFGWN